MPKPFGQSCTWASASYPMPISSNLPNVHVSGQGSRNRLPPSPNILEHDKVLRLLGFTNRILSYGPRGLLLAIFSWTNTALSSGWSRPRRGRMATQAWWPLVLAAQQRRMGGGLIPDRPQHLQTEPDWLMRTVEEYWVGPCSAKLPEIMHGTPCM